MPKEKIIIILGPTASGKSELAVRLAKKFNGEVISADSRQVYKGLDIGSGKITQKEMKSTPHHLLNVVSPKKVFTAQDFKKLGQKIISEIRSRKKIPIICGGTGFYIDALLGVKKIPEILPDWPLRKKLEKKSTEELFRILKKLDPRRAKNIDSKNRRRLIRAIEIIKITKKPVPPPFFYGSRRSVRRSAKSKYYEVLFLGIITHPPEILKKLIEKRVETMIKKGLVKEVKKLRAQSLSWKRISELGFEYKYPALYLQKKITKEEMLGSLKKENWRYAKRQITWFKRNPKILWIKSPGQAEKLIKDFL